MFRMKFIFVVFLILGYISEIFSNDYLHFGGTEEESRQAAYYLSADSGSNAGPTDELKRTQRSFWKKLFKNGLFGECDNCCNNCNYNAGNGDIYNPIPSSLLPFQPFRPLPLWRPLQPLFGPINYDIPGTSSYTGGNSNNYGNPPSYGVNNYGGEGYDNSLPPAPEPVYDIPTDLPPENPDYKIDNTPVAEDTYEPPNAPTPSSYANTETPKGPQQYTNGKVPQIIYQPIIYVSPQYQGNKPTNQYKEEEENKYSDEPEKEDEKDQNYETDSESEDKPSSYDSESEYTKSDDGSSSSDNTADNASSDLTKPCAADGYSYNQHPFHCSGHPHTNPAVSTVSTIYNIISPSLLHSLSDRPNSYNSGLIASHVPCANSGPSLYPTNNVHQDSYSLPAEPSPSPPSPSPPVPEHASSYEPPKQTYTQPIPLTPDDQPYRVCPELFLDYQRKLNSLLPHLHAARGGNTFVNAQLIHY